MGPSSSAALLVAGCCRWVTGRPYDMAASMAHRQRAMVTLLQWCSWAGAWFDSGYKFQRLRTVEVPLFVHRQSGGYCSFTETGSHSATCYVCCDVYPQCNSADDRRDSPGAVFGPVVDMPVIVQRHMHSSRLSWSSTSPSWRRCSLLWYWFLRKP